MSDVFNKLMEKIEILMARLPDILMDKILEMAIVATVSKLGSYVVAWIWNKTNAEEMRRKFEGLLSMARKVSSKLTAQLANTANSMIQQLLRVLQQLMIELQNEARQGIQLLGGQLMPVNLCNVEERFERIKAVALKLYDLLLRNARETGVHPRIKRPHFKPRYLRRRTRFQVLVANCS